MNHTNFSSSPAVFLSSCILLAASALGTLACPMEDDDGAGGGGAQQEGGQGGEPCEGGAGGVHVPVGDLSGIVTRNVEIAAGNDGIGNLYIGAFDQCDLAAGSLLGGALVPNADLSDEDAEAAFTLAGLQGVVVYLVAFLDDNGDAMPNAPLPGPGDLVYTLHAGDGVVDCVPVALVDGGVADVAIPLIAVEE